MTREKKEFAIEWTINIVMFVVSVAIAVYGAVKWRVAL